MNESDYWGQLEYRVCRELDGVPSGRNAQLWCDGLVAETYLLSLTPACAARPDGRFDEEEHRP